jgi:glutamate/tyrosine decarboxylase-like PLP-dependent enzyme
MEQKQVLGKLFEIIDGYLAENQNPDTPVVNYRDPQTLRDQMDFSVPEAGVSDSDLIELIEKYLKYSMRTGHPQFLNQLYQGFNLAGFSGEVVTALANTSMYTYEVAPVATLIEQALVEKMCGLIGYEEGDGIFLTGGSNANLNAVLAARNRADPSCRQDGLKGPLALFVSEKAHYSFEKAANVLGLGISAVVKVASDHDGRMVPAALERAIQTSIKGGRKPFFVGATAGTTVLGAFDPFPELAEIASRHGLWFHVDGALGGSALLSSRHRHLMAGAHLADSVAWNPHKTMGVPLVCSALLMKDRGVLEETTSCDHSNYLFHGEDSYDLGKKSLQCGRRVDSLKLWLSWKYFGDAGYDARVTHLFALAEYAASVISADPRLELLAPVASVNVCFQYTSEGLSPEETSSFTRRIRDHMLQSGRTAVNYATHNGRIAIRMAFINPDIGTEDVDRFFRNVHEAAGALKAAAPTSASAS